MLRVGMFSPYSLTIPGGVQNQVMALARTLRGMGIEVRVLGPCDGPPPATFVTPLGNSLPTAANGSIAPLAPDPSASLRTIRALLDERFDVLHIHEPYAPGPTMTTLVLHPAPIVATFHAAGESLSYDLLAPLIRWWGAGAVSHAVVVSDDARQLVTTAVPDAEYELLYNGIELQRYRAAEPTPTDGPTIFFCGRHEERKGLEVLLQAMPALGDDVRLWVASSGPDSDRLRATYGGDARIEWLGQVSDEEKFRRLRGADVFSAPSLRGESFGVVLIEAMAAGTTVVASSLDGYRNVATDDVDALLVEPGDVAALAAALRRVLGDATLAARLRAAGDARAEDFSMDRLAARYAEIYEMLAASGQERSPWQLRTSLLRHRLSRTLTR